MTTMIRLGTALTLLAIGAGLVSLFAFPPEYLLQ